MTILTDGINNLTKTATGTIGKITGDIGSAFNKAKSLISDPSAIRSQISGLASGGIASIFNAAPSFGGATSTSMASFAGSEADWRVRISVSENSGVLNRSGGLGGILSPLNNTNGVIFPYVPSVTINHTAKYGTQSLTHTNYSSYFYESSEVTSIVINAEFSVQNTDDAEYFLAMIYFFRAATKMFYGDSGKYQGSPPPIVYLDGYGKHYLPHVPCVVTNFSHTMPNDVDYIPVMANGGNGSAGEPNRVPTLSQITVTLQPVYSRARQRSFNHDNFAKGNLINKGFL